MWRACGRRWRRRGGDLSLYAHPQGYTPLREFVAAKLQRDRAIDVTAREIILGAGSSQPIHMIAETLLDPGDVVLTEDFVYAGTAQYAAAFSRGPAGRGDR